MLQFYKARVTSCSVLACGPADHSATIFCSTHKVTRKVNQASPAASLMSFDSL